MKALCAVDGSKYSSWAVEALGALFHQSLREVILVHVMDPSPFALGLKKEGAKTGKVKKVLTGLEAEGRKILKTAEAQATRVLSQRKRNHDVRVRSVLAKGHAAYAIVKEAEKRKPAVIVLGSRGFHEIKGYLMGSVSRKVLTHAPSPVLIVKEPLPIPAQVVLAVDGSNASKRAANYLKSWIPSNLISAHVLSVVPKSLGGSARSKPYGQALMETFQKQAQDMTAQVRELLRMKNYEVTSQVVAGNPRETILNCLVEQEANLAVLGAKGLTSPERFPMGSVSEWIAAYSGCSILVVRPQPN
jgi:nucleotide-binding universal stress UspA family protein